MQEYLDLNHMSKAQEVGAYLIPHHGILKADRNNKKIRVVFDASARTNVGSLNDFLLTGPKLQNNIVDILLNFRRHKYVFTVDLVKMFRQILVHPCDRIYQHILWRFDPGDPVEEFVLNTVTYGQGPAPYLAIRCIKQLVEDDGHVYPLAAKAIEEDMYVDDLVTGANSLEGILELQSQVISLFSKGEFPLSKWSSNNEHILERVKDHSNNSVPRKIENPDDRCRNKILGLEWDPKSDVFSYEVSPPIIVTTKRAILAAVSRIYDPLGLVAPLVITAKALIQTAWKMGLKWDETLPSTLQEQWASFVHQLSSLSGLRIPRWVCPSQTPECDILVFGDASELAYCATAYLRVHDGNEIRVSLLLSKTKLAPIKSTSIPRLELCAAMLATRLVESLFSFSSRLHHPPTIHLFTDSTVVLTWLNIPPYKLKTFVANRVTRILEVTSLENWSHVRSEDNPSDLGSRGLTAAELIDNSLWFHGPEWAQLKPCYWPVRSFAEFRAEHSLPEMKTAPALVVSAQETHLLTNLDQSSSLEFTIRKLAWLLRFIFNCRHPHPERLQSSLTVKERHTALITYIKLTQRQEFHSLKPNSLRLSFSKNLLALNPFTDTDGVLRVGGRIHHANLPYGTRHPYIIPAKSHLSHLIIDQYHRFLMHPGPSLLLSVIRRKFWIIHGRNQIRQYTKNCIACNRFHGRPCQPKMANLPLERLEGGRAFLNVGVDFAGPFMVRESLRRKAALSKAYMCVFVCLGSRAIHLEAVSSISTPAFLAALDRFISRRGLPTTVFSDNGSNFIGASRCIKEWYERKVTHSEITRYSNSRCIEWRFTPPYAPHFGGLWEAGVRSAKRHIRSAYGEGVFTFEELATLFAKVEAILNSRPICPLSADPEDLDALTPGHLLIGGPLMALPEPSLTEVKEGRLNRWQIIQQRTQFFWKRWKSDCLHELQIRSKWYKQERNLKVNDLVLVKGDNADRQKWPLARIVKVFPGTDDVVRVVQIHTANGSFRRPATKIIPLLAFEEESNSFTSLK